MMIVKKITWLSVAAQEAELLISDGKYECLAFSQPCMLEKGDMLKDPLHAFMVDSLMISREGVCSISLVSIGGLEHHCVAKVVNADTGLICIGDLQIILESMVPSWANVGNLIEFNCLRLDVK